MMQGKVETVNGRRVGFARTVTGSTWSEWYRVSCAEAARYPSPDPGRRAVVVLAHGRTRLAQFTVSTTIAVAWDLAMGHEIVPVAWGTPSNEAHVKVMVSALGRPVEPDERKALGNIAARTRGNSELLDGIVAILRAG